MDDTHKDPEQLLSMNARAPELIKQEFGSIIKMTGIQEEYEKLVIHKVADPELGYHFIMRHFLSEDKKYCATAGSDSRVILWDLENARPFRIFTGHTQHVTSVCMTPDNAKVISGSKDRTIRIWDVATGYCRVLDRHSAGVYCLAINNDGSFFASGGRDNTVRLWQTETGRLVKTLNRHLYSVLCLCFSQDGKRILSGGGDGKLVEWSLYSDNCRIVYKGVHIIDALAPSPDSNFIVIGSREKSLKLIKWKNGKLIKDIDTDRTNIFDIAFSQDGRHIAICGKPRKIKIYAIPSGKCIKNLTICNEHVHKIDFFHNKQKLLTSSGDTTIRIWDLENDQAITTIKSDNHVIRCIGISPDLKFLAAGTGKGHVLIWDLTTCRLVKILTGHDGLIRSLAFHMHRPCLYTGSWDGSVRAWNTGTWESAGVYKGFQERIYSIVLHHDDTLYAADHTGLIRQLDSGLCLYMREYRSSEYCYAVSSNRRYLAAGSGTRIIVWDLLFGIKQELRGHADDLYYVLLHPREPLLLSASMDGTLRLWDIAAGVCLKEYRGHEGRVTYVTADKNFIRAFSVGTDATLRRWNIKTGECEKVYRGHTSPVHAVFLAEDNNLVLTGSDDGTIRFWEISEKEDDNQPFAVLSVYKDYYLWTLKPEKGIREGWFFTENPQKLTIVKKNAGGDIISELACGELDREMHIGAYNRPDIVSARILNPKKYRELVEAVVRKSGIDRLTRDSVKLITEGGDWDVP